MVLSQFRNSYRSNLNYSHDNSYETEGVNTTQPAIKCRNIFCATSFILLHPYMFQREVRHKILELLVSYIICRERYRCTEQKNVSYVKLHALVNATKNPNLWKRLDNPHTHINTPLTCDK
jgi:hypothetical protein